MMYTGESASMGPPQRVVGPSTTQPTLFGVLGMFRSDNKFQALQQTFVRKPIGKLPKLMAAPLPAPKTHIPGLHHGMVPFAGVFMSSKGEVEVLGHRHMDR